MITDDLMNIDVINGNQPGNDCDSQGKNAITYDMSFEGTAQQVDKRGDTVCSNDGSCADRSFVRPKATSMSGGIG